jgi:hypothetical protein
MRRENLLKKPDKFYTVKQTNDHNCGAAVAAMAVGDHSITFAEQNMNLSAATIGGKKVMCYKVSETAGFLAWHGILMGLFFRLLSNPMDPELRIETSLKLKDRPCLLSVKSEKYTDADHWVFWDGQYVRDPNPAQAEMAALREYRVLEVYPLVYLEEPEDEIRTSSDPPTQRSQELAV